MMRALRELVEQMRARGLSDHARGLGTTTLPAPTAPTGCVWIIRAT